MYPFLALLLNRHVHGSSEGFVSPLIYLSSIISKVNDSNFLFYYSAGISKGKEYPFFGISSSFEKRFGMPFNHISILTIDLLSQLAFILFYVSRAFQR